MKIMKSLLTIALMLSPLAAKANFNSDCKFAYREATVSLVETANDFKDQKISSNQFGAEVAMIDIGAKEFRAACYFTESTENRQCVLRYKEIYSSLRDNFKALALLLGNQEKVDYNVLDSISTKAKVKIADLVCGY